LFELVVRELHEYLDGRRRGFSVPARLDGPPMDRQVWELLAAIPYGETTTYRALAAQLGWALDPKQVGAAVGRNPLCLLVPCHRVVSSSGALSGYAGGVRRKQFLLDLERRAVRVAESAA
jgi:methylated-DNA-[protein]-cysteine S-methyltransferase